jgi:hypothetical protein
VRPKCPLNTDFFRKAEKIGLRRGGFDHLFPLLGKFPNQMQALALVTQMLTADAAVKRR